MIFLRRDRRGSARWMPVRVGLFFLAAGIWVAGASVGNDWVTGAAIVVAIVALLLGVVVRRNEMRAPDEQEEI